MCAREAYTREVLDSIKKSIPKLQDIARGRKTVGGPGVLKSLVAPDAASVCPGTVRILDELRWICENRDGATYQWFRFVPQEVRGEGKPGVQLGELVLSRNGRRVDLSQINISVLDGDSPEGMGPSKAFDGKAGTQWQDRKMGWLVVRFESPTTVDRYSITSGSNSPECDPVSWRLEGSQDGENFVRLHDVIKVAPAWERYTEIGSYPVTNTDPLRAIRELVGDPPDLMDTLCRGVQFTEWIAQEVVPIIKRTVTSLCCLLPFADDLNTLEGRRLHGVCERLHFIRQSSLMQKCQECQAALVRALREALSFGVASSRALSAANAKDDTDHTPVFNIPLLNALAPQSRGCVVKELHLKQLATRCLKWPTSSM